MNEDYKVERVSRLVTDSSSAYFNTEPSVLTSLGGQTIYRVGAGNSGWYDTQGNINWNVSAWGAGLTAGVTQLAGSYDAGNGVYNVEYSAKNYEICTPDNALPSNGQPGDSGSPLFIWNETQGRFEFVGPLQGASDTFWISRYNPSATQAAIDYCTVTFATSVDYNAQAAEDTTYYLSGAKVRPGDTLIEDGSAATYLRQGSISLGGLEVARFNGVALDEFSEGTWKKLDADSLTWYTYSDADYINARPDVAQGADAFGSEDLFYTSNLHFSADADGGSATAHRRIELTDDVDLGVGHVQFSLGEGTTCATYDLGQSAPNFFLSSAGFVVDKGVTLNNYFTYEKGRELRRVGEGVMNMVGTGNNDVLLNIGGGGITHLNRTGGYAAYSALVNNRAVLKLADAGQVYNNVTLGANGGVLDFNGNDYRWTSGGARAEGSDGQTYFGLTVYEGLNRVETSTLANYAAGTTTTITIERTDDFEFAGAFRDGSTYTGSGSVEMDSRYTMMPSLLIGRYTQFSAADRQESNSTLKVIYNGGGRMEMTGVYTLLTGNSGFEVASGTVSLHGTNTIHAIGSDSGKDLNRWQNANDWHFAMAEMDVKVGNGGSFELGDHALLLGNVQVEAGGCFIMKQAVNERHEYVEGWYKVEDTYALADYYGLKGNVNLAAGASMSIAFDTGVATQLNYGGNITGEGSLTVDAGEGFVHLTGNNGFSGEKTVASGNLRLAAGAEGDTETNKWKIEAAGSLALESVGDNASLEALVDASSTGVLALTQDFAEQVSLSGLIVGAAEGETVYYGTADRSLQAQGNRWTLGGGGGTLVVDFLLEGDNTLVLGNEYGTGMVVLNNSNNSFSGGIELAGHVTLGYTSAGALGHAPISVGYGSALAAMGTAATAVSQAEGGLVPAGGMVDAASDGMLSLTADSASADYDFTGHSLLSLAAHGEATFTGQLSVAEGASYRLGGSGALTIASALGGAHGILIDGQGNHGSSVIFATASAATGDVVVQGYDADKAASGEVTLSFTTDNALTNAASVSLRNDAGVDLNGTNQCFTNLRGDASSLIFDDKGCNTLTLDYSEDVTLGIQVQAAGTDVVKLGGGTLTLSGEHAWKSLSIQEGVVQVADGKSLGHLASGSQAVHVSVLDGAALRVTQDASFLNTLNIAGHGVGGAGYALMVDGYLNNQQGTLNVTANAAISGRFSFRQLNLQGHDLTVHGGQLFTASAISGGRLILEDGTRMNTLSGSGYTVQLGEGSYVSLDNYKRAESATITTELNGGTLRMSWDADSNTESTYAGNIVVLAAGGAIRNDTWWGERQFHLTGDISGSEAGSTLTFSEREGYGTRTINASGRVELAGTVVLENQVTLNLTGQASIGSLAGDGTLRVTGSTLALTATGSNLLGTLELADGGQLQLCGLADGSSLGSISTLKLGSDGTLHLSSIAGYTDRALLHIGTLSGSGQLLMDASELGSLASGSYCLLTSDSELSGLATLPSGLSGGRREYSLASNALAGGGYALELTITGLASHATWKGTGTLVAGTANAANITTDLATEDHTFMAMDALTITSDAGANDTLTLGGEIHASTLAYTGAGQVSLAQQNGGSFAAGTTLVLDAAGTLNLGDSTAIKGEVELRRGTLSASGAALNAVAGMHVAEGADATLVLTSDTAVTTAIKVDGKLTVDSQQSQNGRNLSGNLSGAGLLVKTNSGKLNLTGDHSAFTGSIEVQNGTLQLGDYENGKLDVTSLNASSISMAGGTSLVLISSEVEYAADITWGDGATLRVEEGTGDGPSATSVGYTLSGKQTLNGTLNYQSEWGKVTHISGLIEGTGELNFSGTNNSGGSPALVLSGNNSYSGGTTINFGKGTLYAAGKNALGTGAILLQSGTLAWHNAGHGWDGDLSAASIVVSGGTMNTNGCDVTYSGSVSGDSGTFTKSGAGTLELANFNYTGATHVQEGTLALGLGKISWHAGFSGDEGTTLRLSSSGTYLMGAISGGVSVELAGDFGYVAANTHTGGTKLLSGSLEIGNVDALKSGSLHAATGTEVSIVMEKTYMAGDSVVDALSFGSGASVLVGTDTAAGHLTFGSLSGTANFQLDVFSADSYDRLSGVLTPGSLLGVTLKSNELGSYLLVAGDNSGYDTTSITLSGTDASLYSYYWSHTDAGLTLTIDHAAGSVNVWTGGPSGIWSSTSSAWNGGSAFNTAVNNASIRVAEDTTITLGGFVGSNELVLTADTAAGCTLTLDSATYSLDMKQLVKDGEGALVIKSGSADYVNMNYGGGVLVNAGVLSVDDISALGNDDIIISGNGTFELRGGTMGISVNSLKTKGISVAEGTLTISSVNTTLEGRNISIARGGELRMGYWDNLNNNTILLKDGGKLAMQSSGCGNNSFEVEGSGTFAIGQTCGSEDSDKVLDINSTMSGKGMLSFTNETSKNAAVYEVRVNGVISDGSNGALALSTDQGNLHLKAANTYSGGTTITGGHVTTHTASALGTGSVTLNNGTLTLGAALNIGSLSGKDGTIEAGVHDLTINQTKAATYAGDIVSSASITKTGAAGLSLTGENLSAKTLVVQGGILSVGTISLSDGLDMKQAGIALNIGTLHLAAGATLSYSAAYGNVSIGELQAAGSFTLSLADSLQDYLFGKTDGGYNILDLGVNLGASADKALVSGLGLEAGMYTIGFNAATGHSTLQLTSSNPWHVAWDTNWGIADAPLRAEHTTLTSSNNSFAGTACDDGTRIVVGVLGTEGSSPLNLYATANGGNAVSREAWVEVEGGTYGVIAGARNLSVTGDIHFVVSGGAVNDVVGYGYGNSSGVTTLKGDTYVSVYEGASIYDSVIGGGVMTDGKAANIDGSTHVYIYGVLDTNADTLVGDGIGAIHNAVIGGHAHGSTGGEAWSISGSTHVTVDVTANTDADARFVKAIYGGSVSDKQWGNIGGSSSVLINAGDNVTFADNIVAGSRQKGSTGVVRIMNDSTLTVNGGTYEGGSGKYLTGGNVVDASEGVLAGQASVILNGGTINRNVYAAGISNGGSSSVGATRVEIGEDVSFGNVTVSGGFGGTNASAGKVNDVYKRVLALQDGADLSSTSASFKEFTLVEVDSGTAKLDAGCFDQAYSYRNASGGGFEKSGAGTLVLSGTEKGVDILLGVKPVFRVWEGMVKVVSDTALNVTDLKVYGPGTFEVGEGNHVSLTGAITFNDGASLSVNSLDATQAALATSSSVTLSGALTLNVSAALSGSGYKVLSGAAGLSSAGTISVNYTGEGRYSYTTRLDANTLYLEAIQDTSATLVWGGTAESGTWNQSSQNTNWNTGGDTPGNSSFMNQDSVSFTEAAANKDVAVAESGVQVDKMTVSGADYSFSGGAVKAESVTVEQGASMNMGAVYTLAQKEAETRAAAIGAVTMGSDSAKNTGYIHGAVAGELSALDNVVIDIAKGATLELKDILLTDSSRITDDPATVAVENVTVALSEANAILEGSSTLNIGTELVPAGGGASFVLTEAVPVVTVFSTALDTVNVTGTSLTIDLSGFEASLGPAWQENGYVAISFGQEAGSAGTLAHFDVTSGLSISATYGGSTYAVYVNKAEQGSASTLYVSTTSDAIPEPTTATLSLLALSLLAARRRRK